MKKKDLILVILVIVFAVGASVGVVALTSDKTATSSNHEESEEHDEHKEVTAPVVDLTDQSQVAIDIKDAAYSMPNIKIKAGTTVTWTNQDTVKQNAMREHDGGAHAHKAPAKEDVSPTLFAGPLLAKGESYSFTFPKVDTVHYHSAPDPDIQGLITVVE